MRPLVTVLGFAAATAAITLAMGWSRPTYADPPETFFGAGDVDDLTFTGEVVHDTSFKTGWAIKVTYENRGDRDQTAQMDTELTRQQVNPMSRASPPGLAVWHHKDKVLVAAHDTVVRTYEIPASMAAQLTANDKAAAVRQKLIDRETNKPTPSYAVAMRPFTMFGVAFQKMNG